MGEEFFDQFIQDGIDLDVMRAFEETTLESSQVLKHHTKAECSGKCCLHGSSPYAACRFWRSWRTDIKALEHHCPCGVGHPCPAGLDYTRDAGIHDCCGIEGHCGMGLELTATGPNSKLDEADGHQIAVELGPLLTFMIDQIEKRDENMQTAINLMNSYRHEAAALRKLVFLTIFAFIAVILIDTAFYAFS